MKNSECVFCGECVRVCPVGALYEKQGRFKGRAARLRKVRTTCAYCGVGCQMELNVKDGKVVKVTTPRWNASAPNHGSLCIKGRFGYDFVGHPDRLTKPLIRKDGELKEATWDEAISLYCGEACRDQRKAWAGCHCRIFIGPLHQRGKLPLPEILPRGDRHQQRRSLRPALTQLHRGRSGHCIRFRRNDQLHRRHRRNRSAS